LSHSSDKTPSLTPFLVLQGLYLDVVTVKLLSQYSSKFRGKDFKSIDEGNTKIEEVKVEK